MKKLLVVMCMAIFSLLVLGCGAVKADAPKDAPQQESSQPEVPVEKRALVAYFSRADENYGVGYVKKGNTRILAEMLAEKTGADIFEIKADHAYPKEYKAATEAAKAEKEANARPGLTGTMPDLSKYDVIYLGYPIWWSDMPMAVYTFLEQGNFAGKTIIPFCTHEGSGISGTEDYIKEATGAKVLAGFELRGSIAQKSPEEAREQLYKWLDKTQAK